MWLFTDKGFISAVAYNAKKDMRPNPLNRRARKRLGARPILARARVQADLEQLRPYFPNLMVWADGGSDYKFRALLPRRAWVDFLADAGEAIDYDSHFKEAARERSPKCEGRYSAMMGVWSAMMKLQPTRPYSSLGGGSKKGKSGSSWTSAKEWCPDRSPATDGGQVPGRYCNFEVGHSGAHSWELPAGTAATTLPFSAAEKPAARLSDIGRCVATHSTRGRCSFNNGHHGRHSWSDAGEATLERTHSYLDTRDAAASYPDTVVAMAKELIESVPANVHVDLATPTSAFDLWVAADELVGDGDAALSGDDVADLLKALIEDWSTTPERVDEYVEALNELGFDYEATEESEDGTAVLADDTPAGEKVGESR